MAWDVERTKQLLLDAATAEFSAYGMAGARIDRIAASAGVNKERIYQYFGKKSEFFGIVLERQLAAVMDAVQITGTGVEAITEYTGKVFDYQVEHPELARLTFWEGLECDRPTAEDKRRLASDSKVVLVQQALPTISQADARDLLLTILTLADGWQVLHTLDRLYTRTITRDAVRNASRRRAVVTAIESLTRELL